jgi:hypothetical protein
MQSILRSKHCQVIAEGADTFDKFSAEGLGNVETRRFRVDRHELRAGGHAGVRSRVLDAEEAGLAKTTSVQP